MRGYATYLYQLVVHVYVHVFDRRMRCDRMLQHDRCYVQNFLHVACRRLHIYGGMSMSSMCVVQSSRFQRLSPYMYHHCMQWLFPISIGSIYTLQSEVVAMLLGQLPCNILRTRQIDLADVYKFRCLDQCSKCLDISILIIKRYACMHVIYCCIGMPLPVRSTYIVVSSQLQPRTLVLTLRDF